MKLDIARAWKDENYRNSLSSEQLAQLPANPVGQIELTEEELQTVDGGTDTEVFCIITPSVSLATYAVTYSVIHDTESILTLCDTAGCSAQ